MVTPAHSRHLLSSIVLCHSLSRDRAAAAARVCSSAATWAFRDACCSAACARASRTRSSSAWAASRCARSRSASTRACHVARSASSRASHDALSASSCCRSLSALASAAAWSCRACPTRSRSCRDSAAESASCASRSLTRASSVVTRDAVDSRAVSTARSLTASARRSSSISWSFCASACRCSSRAWRTASSISRSAGPGHACGGMPWYGCVWLRLRGQGRPGSSGARAGNRRGGVRLARLAAPRSHRQGTGSARAMPRHPRPSSSSGERSSPYPPREKWNLREETGPRLLAHGRGRGARTKALLRPTCEDGRSAPRGAMGLRVAVRAGTCKRRLFPSHQTHPRPLLARHLVSGVRGPPGPRWSPAMHGGKR